MKKPKSSVLIPILYVVSFVVSVAPVLVFFLINVNDYVSSVPEGIKLGFGGILLLFVVLLKVIGKLKMPSRVVLFGFLFLLSYLLSSILEDIIIFMFLALVGEIGDSICQFFIRREKEKALTDKTASKTAEEIKKVLNNGRV